MALPNLEELGHSARQMVTGDLAAPFGGIGEEPLICICQPGFELSASGPPQIPQPIHIHQLPRRPIRLAVIKYQLALKTRHLGHRLRQLADRHICAGTHIDVREHRLRVRPIGLHIQSMHEEARLRHVIHVQKLPLRRPRAPDRHGRGPLLHRLMEAPDHGRHHVAVLGVEIVERAVEVGGHYRPVVGAVLAVVALAQLDAGDLGNCIGLVGGLERAGEQGLLRHRLLSQARIDAGAPQKQQLVHPVGMRRLDDIGLHHQVVVDEVRRVGTVGVDAPDQGGRQDHLVRLLGGKEMPHGRLVGEIEFGMGAHQQPLGRMPFLQQPADDGRADHTAMSGDVDERVVHGKEDEGMGRLLA